MAAKGLDWAKQKTVQAMAEWIRKSSTVGGGGCLVVVAIRVDDLAIAADPKLAPRDVLTVIDNRIPELTQLLDANRRAHLAQLDKKREREERRAAR